MKRNITSGFFLVFAIVLFAFLAGCGPSCSQCKVQGHREGYREGLSTGRQQGRVQAQEELHEQYASAKQRGYADGFKRAFPGGSVGSPLWKHMLTVFAYLGLVKVLASLLLATAWVISCCNSTALQAVGKSIYATLGFLAVAIISISFSTKSSVLPYLMIPTPDSPILRGTVVLAGALCTYVLLRILIPFFHSEHKNITLAWAAFFLSLVSTLYTKVFLDLLNVPSIADYLPSLASLGGRCGVSILRSQQVFAS